jgi:hypothetical protein
VVRSSSSVEIADSARRTCSRSSRQGGDIHIYANRGLGLKPDLGPTGAAPGRLPWIDRASWTEFLLRGILTILLFGVVQVVLIDVLAGSFGRW